MGIPAKFSTLVTRVSVTTLLARGATPSQGSVCAAIFKCLPQKCFSPPAPFLKMASIVIPETEVIDERERLLIEAVLSLARTLRDERDRLAERLRSVENELSTLASRLEIVGLEPPDPSATSEEINP
jgi:hypothetical protein